MAPKPRPAKKAKVEPKFYSKKYNTPDADVIIQCKDGWDTGVTFFAVRRSVLVAASSVFEDMFAIPQVGVTGGIRPQRLAEQQAPGELPAVEVTDSSYSLGIVLDLIHRQYVETVVDHLRPEADVYAILCIIGAMSIADKYDVPSAMAMLCSALENHVVAGEGRAGQDPEDGTHLDALAAAIIFKKRQIAEKVLNAWWNTPMEQDQRKGLRVCDIDEDLFVRVPLHVIQPVLRLEALLQTTPRPTRNVWDSHVDDFILDIFD